MKSPKEEQLEAIGVQPLGPVRRKTIEQLLSTPQYSSLVQVHGRKVHLLAFYDIGPISPLVSPLKVGSAWRTFLATIGED